MKKAVCILFIVLFALSIAAPVLATHEEQKMEKVISYLAKPEGQGKPTKPGPTATVSIRNIPSGDTVYGSVLVVAQASGAASVVCKIGSVEATMSLVAGSDRYVATLDTKSYAGTTQTITIEARGNTGNILAKTLVNVNVATGYLYKLYYEIDCIAGYSPSPTVLQYLTGYWGAHAIEFNYLIDDKTIADPTPSSEVTSSDFWYIEKNNNDGVGDYGGDEAVVLQDSNGNYYGKSGFFTSKAKWMLYGDWDASSSNVGGYTYVVSSGRDYVGGNYIFIAEAMIQNWESGFAPGGEAIVAMHEAGHSVGIVIGTGGEKYDTDYYSIMSLMRTQNAKAMAGNWYYSKEYWSAANLNYYLSP